MPTNDKKETYTTAFIRGDWDKAVYLDSVHADNLMTAFLGLGAEFWTMRRRLLVLETFMAKGGVIDPVAIEAYDPTPEEKAAWEAERDSFIERIFSVLTRNAAPTASTFPDGKSEPVRPGSF